MMKNSGLTLILALMTTVSAVQLRSQLRDTVLVREQESSCTFNWTEVFDFGEHIWNTCSFSDVQTCIKDQCTSDQYDGLVTSLSNCNETLTDLVDNVNCTSLATEIPEAGTYCEMAKMALPYLCKQVTSDIHVDICNVTLSQIGNEITQFCASENTH
mmetsp:Transcript_554/g.711  ORF Transcript_554/g.711 Transcript_554/m.711 type:complete len:157 (-) Transcript_554:3-473(-)